MLISFSMFTQYELPYMDPTKVKNVHALLVYNIGGPKV